MWKISLKAIVNHPSGVGLGLFPSAYGDAQAAYFASGNASQTEEFVAGNPDYAFNEFLQIAVELFTGMLVSSFRGLKKHKNGGLLDH